jgi:outer membrane protein TolC
VLDVQQAISNLQQAQETIDSQTASVVQAAEALRLSRERLDAGAGTQLDVLNAQVQLLQAQTNVLQARFDYISAMASYDFALSLDTQYVETFDDPLVRPLNPQALNKFESKRFQR